MIKAIALAGATAALVIGSLAIAQTTAADTNNPPASASSADQSGANASANANGAADNAGQSGVNSSATGERG
ncbi:MAG TPA: hypothetical protein VGI30_07975 [Caulobacteraceae bacterium]